MSDKVMKEIEVIVHEECPACGLIKTEPRKFVPGHALDHIRRTAGKDFWTDSDSEGGHSHWRRNKVCGECEELDAAYRLMR